MLSCLNTGCAPIADLIEVLTNVGKPGYRGEKLDMVFLISMALWRFAGYRLIKSTAY